ncbi:MAG: tyrosine-type recombinase/integrase [Vampirovibrionales bacterium]|nr:tyrosine-type recombinase/integrase [Vampirovibrionales bacterium]
MGKEYTLTEAAAITGEKYEKLKVDSRRGILPTEVRFNGKKPYKVISAETLALLLQKKNFGGYEALKKEWKNEMLTGIHAGLDGTPVTEGYFTDLEWGLKKYWGILDVQPSVEQLNIENWRKVYMHYRPDEQKRRDYYSTKMHIYKALCSFTTFLIKHGHRSNDALSEIKSLRPSPKYKPKRHAMTMSEVWEAINFNSTWRDGRTYNDIHMMELLLYLYGFSGLRRMEAANIEVADINFQTQELLVHGKGGKDRIVTLPSELNERLKRWVETLRPESDLPYILVNINGSQLTEQTITLRFTRFSQAMRMSKAKLVLQKQDPETWAKLGQKERTKRADEIADSIDWAVRPHDLRRFYARMLHEQGLPMRDVQEILGHSKIETTEKYVNAQQQQSSEWVRKHFRISLPEASETEKIPPASVVPAAPSPLPSESITLIQSERKRRFRY